MALHLHGLYASLLVDVICFDYVAQPTVVRLVQLCHEQILFSPMHAVEGLGKEESCWPHRGYTHHLAQRHDTVHPCRGPREVTDKRHNCFSFLDEEIRKSCWYLKHDMSSPPQVFVHLALKFEVGACSAQHLRHEGQHQTPF